MLTSYLMNAPLNRDETIDETIPDFYHILHGGQLRDLIKMSTSVAFNNSIPLLVKTHYLPSSVAMRQCESVTGKAVYIVRNPRDVILSSARYAGIVPSHEKKSREWVRDFIAKRGDNSWPDLTGRWAQNVQQWTSLPLLRQYFPGIQLLAVRYEDIRSDPVGKLHQIVSFLGLDGATQRDRIQGAVDNSSIERMRALEDKVLERQGIKDPVSSAGHQRRFVNQGLHNQSLTIFGEDIEAEYKRLITEDEEFYICAEQFGYVT